MKKEEKKELKYAQNSLFFLGLDSKLRIMVIRFIEWKFHLFIIFFKKKKVVR